MRLSKKKKKKKKYILIGVNQQQDWNPPCLYNSNFDLIRAHRGGPKLAGWTGPIFAANFSPAGPYLAGDQISRDRHR